jgi:hypothetical protein
LVGCAGFIGGALVERGDTVIVATRPGTTAGKTSQLGSALFGPLLSGKQVRVFGSPTEPNSPTGSPRSRAFGERALPEIIASYRNDG